MSRIGFTGSRQGITVAQAERVQSILEELWEELRSEFHHGNCVGADETALKMAGELGYWTVAHPANGLGRLQLALSLSDTYRERRSPLARNEDIVIATDILIACPKESEEPPVRRGQGTWSCVRFARKFGAPYTIIWPDGTLGA